MCIQKNQAYSVKNRDSSGWRERMVEGKLTGGGGKVSSLTFTHGLEENKRPRSPPSGDQTDCSLWNQTFAARASRSNYCYNYVEHRQSRQNCIGMPSEAAKPSYTPRRFCFLCVCLMESFSSVQKQHTFFCFGCATPLWRNFSATGRLDV